MKKILFIALALIATNTMFAKEKCCKGKSKCSKEATSCNKKQEAKAEEKADSEGKKETAHACCKKAAEQGKPACCKKPAQANAEEKKTK